MSTGLDFTTLTRVRRMAGFDDDDVSKDAWLSSLISSVSAEMEGELRRFAKQQAHTEILPLWSVNRVLSLSGSPVLDTPAPVLKAANDRDFVTSPTTLVRGQDFILENDTGIVRMLVELRGITNSAGRVVGPTYIQAVYTGGYATTTANFIASYPDLATAADLQVAYLFKRKDSPGGNVVVGPNSTNYDRGYDWLPSVRRSIDLRKRRGIY